MAYTHNKDLYYSNLNPYLYTNEESLEPGAIPVNTTIKPIEKKLSTAEIEKDEVVFQPNGLLLKALGNKHAKGGTPVNLPDNSFVFSNHKPLAISKEDKELFKFKEGGKYKEKNNTPAKLLQKEVDIKHHNRMIAIQDSDAYDGISKKSSELMIQKNFKKAGQVAFLQEEKKGFPDGLPEFSEATAPIDNKNAEAMEGQFMQLGGKLKKKGYGNVYGPKYTQYTTEHPENFNIPESYIPFNIDASQHQNPDWGSEAYGSDLSNEFNQDFRKRHDWFFKNERPGHPLSTRQFQTAYNEEAQRRGYDPYFVGKAGENPRAIDGKFGEYTRRAPGFKGINIARPPMEGMFPFGAPDEPAKPIDNPVLLKDPHNPLTFNPSSPNEDVLPYNPEVPLTADQKLSLGVDAYNFASINKYYPKRQQNSFTPVNLEKINAQPYINQINNQTQQAYRANQAMSPIQARAMNSRIYGQGLSQGSQVLGNINNQNMQISNQENMYNNQGTNRNADQNSALDNQYYSQVQATNQNYDNEKRFAGNRLSDKFMEYRGTNDALKFQLASQRTMGTIDVWEGPNGEISKTPKPGYRQRKQAAPLYDYNARNNSVYYTGAGLDFNQLPTNTQTDPVMLKIQQNIMNGTATDADKLAYSRLYRPITSRGR